MTSYLKLYLSSLAAFLLLDMLWLGILARSFYQRHLGYLLAPQTIWLAAILFYLLFVAGLIHFVVLPGRSVGSLRHTLVRGAFFGLIAYATYDLTNLATIRDWPFILTLVDLAWGTVLSALVSMVGFWVARRLG